MHNFASTERFLPPITTIAKAIHPKIIARRGDHISVAMWNTLAMTIVTKIPAAATLVKNPAAIARAPIDSANAAKKPNTTNHEGIPISPTAQPICAHISGPANNFPKPNMIAKYKPKAILTIR